MVKQKGKEGKGNQEPYTEVCFGDKALSVERVKEILGWEECDGKEEGCLPAIHSAIGKWVRLTNNRNRPIQPGWLMALAQEHLRGRFKFNGESISLDTSRKVLSGQHRLVSFVIGWYLREEGDKLVAWKALRPGPYVLPTVICHNVPPDDDTFQTLNCGRPATVTDVLHRSEKWLDIKDSGKRTKVGRALTAAVGLLWKRTGVGLEEFSEYQTVSESMGFLSRHPTLLDAATHIVEEDSGKGRDEAPSRVVGRPGAAAGMLYLMGVSLTDPAAYRAALTRGEAPGEELLDLSRMDEARRFWVLLSGETKYGKVVSKAMEEAAYVSCGGNQSKSGRAIVVKAWAKFLCGKLDRTDPEELLPEYGPEDVNGRRVVVENCALEGIDLGDRPEESEHRDPPAPTPEEIARRAAALRAEREGDGRNGHTNSRPVPKRSLVG